MSAAPLPGATRAATRPPEARLELVPAPVPRAARAPFVLLVLGVLAVGLLALLMLNTVLAQNAFRLHDQQRRTLLLADRQQQLDTLLTGQRAPGLLATRAQALGMVPGVAQTFVRLADGRVVAVLSPAPRAAPAARPSTTPRPSGVGSPAVGPAGTPAASAGPARTAKPTPTPTPTASPR